MTAAALKIKSTPMAPYMGLVRRMSREDKLALVAFITETLEEPKPYKVMPVSADVRKWNGSASFSEAEIESDPRLKAILSR